jgi:hypothetical protein
VTGTILVNKDEPFKKIQPVVLDYGVAEVKGRRACRAVHDFFERFGRIVFLLATLSFFAGGIWTHLTPWWLVATLALICGWLCAIPLFLLASVAGIYAGKQRPEGW